MSAQIRTRSTEGRICLSEERISMVSIIHESERSVRKEKAITVALQTLMPNGIHAKLLRVGLCLLTLLIAGIAESEQFRTNDPLKAFVNQEYPWGDDYFIDGNRDTYLFRCILTTKPDGIDGIALSEISIWGNQGGPWEIFQH